MKKVSIIKKLTNLALLALTGALFFSCGDSTGLGEAVDLTAPVVTLTSHSDDDTVANEFTLAGTAYDNEKLALITIDFEDADIHYRVTPGSVWKKKTSTTDWTELSSTEAGCSLSGDTWHWNVLVKTDDKTSTKTDYTYELSIIAEDANGNSGRNSKVECTLTVDTKNPDVSITKPDLFKTPHSDAKTKAESYNLKDGNVIARLLNGDIYFSGRQSDSISFRELLIEFDAGELSANTAIVTDLAKYPALSNPKAQEVSDTVKFEGESEKPKVYYSKLIKENSRSWEFTVAAGEWVSETKNSDLMTGRHLIRVVSTSVSNSGAWQKKILGYFIWWPEADMPWLITYLGDETDKGSSAYEVYPSSSFTGQAQDDDGIKKLTYTIQKKNGDVFENYSSGKLGLSEDGAKYAPWSVTTPSENGNFKLIVDVEDLNGNKDTLERYFKTLDVSPPKIEITSPESSSSVLANSDATIKFEGNVSDDGLVSSLCIAFLNPAKSDDAANKIAYMNGSAETAPWAQATESGYTDSIGNKIYKITLGSPDSSSGRNVYTFSKTLNIFSDLGIDGTTKTLDALDFVFRAEDSGSNTVQVFSLTGDTEVPELTIEKLVLKNGSTVAKDVSFTGDDTPTLPVIKPSHTATISGKWSDNSTSKWTSTYKSKIGDIKLTWANNEISATRKNDGTWTAEVSNSLLPITSGLIQASIKDYAGNTKTTSRSVFIESAEAGLESIGSDSDDGFYSKGNSILITLEFTKATTLSQGANPPTLTLNNGGEAIYNSGSGTSKHVYKYTVGESDTSVEKLDVTAIKKNGAVWKDSSTEETIAVSLPAAGNRIGNTRNITIDTEAPKIESVTALSSSGYYKEGASILLMLTFSESVSIENASNLELSFTHNSAKTSGVSASSKNAIFTYTVADGQNTDELKLQSLSHDSVIIKDEAGNTLENWTLPNTTLTNKIVIDTKAPDAPEVSVGWSKPVIFEATTFSITGETGATIEYSTDNGSSWMSYKGTEISLTNNGTYNVTARQTDKAGNVSPNATVQTVTIDKGELLSKITAKTVSGSYSTNTSTKIIEGLINFRKEVKIASGAKVTLNVGNKNDGTISREVSITTAGTSVKQHKFEYEIKEGDYINSSDGKLDVTAWTVDSVEITADAGTVTADVSLPVTGDGTEKAFADNREIYILTGKPEINSVSLTGKGSDAVLKITFDREISKMSGEIVFTHDEDSYRAPSVLSVSEFNELKNKLSSYYTKGMNGAVKNGNYLENDTTTKYVLNFENENTKTEITKIFKDAEKHIVRIPIVSSAVSVEDEKVLTVKLGSTYQLPVKGSTYKLLIPAAAVTDACQNKNTEYETDGTTSKPHLVAEGIEDPVIRINKKGQTITSSGVTATSSVEMPTSAGVKIDCQTPETTIYYETNQNASSQVSVKESPKYYNTKTTDATIPNTINKKYENEFSIGGGTASYDMKGLKIAIAARAEKTSDSSVKSDPCYEYATRTVLKLVIDSADASDTNANTGTSIYEKINGTNTQLLFKDLKVWIVGGDSPYGGNSVDPFPLAWNDPAYFKLMAGSWTTTDGDLLGNWYWISWDITTSTYHGFAIGDVPKDADTKGPTYWYMSECAWVAQKTNYILYPGETLEMKITGGRQEYCQANFLFRDKNEGSR